jgi:large subunit ribosomal protein L23
MAIFGFKKRKDEKLEQSAAAAKGAGVKGSKTAKIAKVASEKKTVAAKNDKVEQSKAVAIPQGSFSNASEAIIRPRVTEKSGILSQTGRYTFEVTTSANKQSIAKAVNALYKVKPVKVTVINTPAKNVFVKGRRGTVAGIRKAIVTLKPGEKIDFV